MTNRRWFWGLLDPHDPDSWFMLIGTLAAIGLVGVAIAAAVLL